MGDRSRGDLLPAGTASEAAVAVAVAVGSTVFCIGGGCVGVGCAATAGVTCTGNTQHAGMEKIVSVGGLGWNGLRTRGQRTTVGFSPVVHMSKVEGIQCKKKFGMVHPEPCLVCSIQAFSRCLTPRFTSVMSGISVRPWPSSGNPSSHENGALRL